MAYEVIARKWRPQQFRDVVGQDHVSATLMNAIRTERVAHAYLFVGPRGTGKTSTARILAKALNCETGPTTNPCDACDACKEIMSGRSLDVLEIDGASNNGVEQVRDLRQNVQYAPARGPYKIYVIDEVHMLSTAAFNALLKTLEEPPGHVKFVFATTEPQKVPATILSRCQRFDLRRIPIRAIVDRLRQITDAEGIDADEAALLAVARGAEGGMRDAQSALDQLIAFRGKQITEEDVLSVFGLVAWQTLEVLVKSILAGDIRGAMNCIADLDRAGKDLQRLVVELLEHFRNLLICACTGGELDQSELTDSQIATLREDAAGLEAGRLLRVVEILMESENRMRYALSRRTLLETAVIKSARAATVVSIDELIRQVETLAGAGGQVRPALPEEGIAVRGGAPEAAVLEDAPPPPPPAVSLPSPPAAETPAMPGEELPRLCAEWPEIVERVGRYASLARSCLLNAVPVRVHAEEVEIGFDPEFRADRDKIDTPRTRKAIAKTLEQHLGRPVRVVCTLLDLQTAAEPLPTDHPAPDQEPDRHASETHTKTRAEWIEEPAVRKTLDLFRGDIVDIRD